MYHSRREEVNAVILYGNVGEIKQMRPAALLENKNLLVRVTVKFRSIISIPVHKCLKLEREGMLLLIVKAVCMDPAGHDLEILV